MRIKDIKFGLAVLLLTVVPAAFAGTPLICFPFDIGGAKSLPWTENQGQGAPRGDYDIRNLTADTMALLGEKTPVIVRMETLRRAVLYAGKSAAAGKDLLEQLKARTATGNGRQLALARFDYGYCIETMRQAGSEISGFNQSGADQNGYALIRSALQISGGDPEMEFAAAVVTIWPKQAAHAEHLRKTAEGAGADALLASNLRSHFPGLTPIPGSPDKSPAKTSMKK